MKLVKKIFISLVAIAFISTATISCKSSDKKSSTSDQTQEFANPPEGNPPEGTPPDGNFPGGTLPEKPNGAPPEGGPGGFGGGFGGGGPGGHASADIDYSGAVEITSKKSEKNVTYSTSTVDQSALLISTSDKVEIVNPTVSKTGDSNGGDSCNFYGLNAAVLVKDGSTTTITGGTISSSANGANGVFSYGGNGGKNGATGDGTTVIISDTKITTTGDGAGGIMTAGGGITKASNLDITTSGRSSAAIRTDRGGGIVTVDGGTYITNGLGSPAIYSTADITVSNATLTSNLSEGVCIEGKNSITLNNSNFKGTVSGKITNVKGKTVSSDVGTVNVKIDSSSTWTLTGNTYITSLEGDVSQINTNGYKLYVGGKLVK